MSAPGDLESIRTRLADALAQLQQVLGEEEARLRGPTGTPVVPPVKRRLLSPQTQPLEAASMLPTGKTVADYFELFATVGMPQRSYNVLDAVIAPEPINDQGNKHDAGQVYDAWILIPTVDSRISFRGPTSQNTPAISAKWATNFQVRARTVWYSSAIPGEKGVMNIWLGRY